MSGFLPHKALHTMIPCVEHSVPIPTPFVWLLPLIMPASPFKLHLLGSGSVPKPKFDAPSLSSHGTLSLPLLDLNCLFICLLPSHIMWQPWGCITLISLQERACYLTARSAVSWQPPAVNAFRICPSFQAETMIFSGSPSQWLSIIAALGPTPSSFSGKALSWPTLSDLHGGLRCSLPHHTSFIFPLTHVMSALGLKMFPPQPHLLTLTFMVLLSNKPLALLNWSMHLFSGEPKRDDELFKGKGHILIQVVSPASITTHNRVSVNNLGRIEWMNECSR